MTQKIYSLQQLIKNCGELRVDSQILNFEGEFLAQ